MPNQIVETFDRYMRLLSEMDLLVKSAKPHRDAYIQSKERGRAAGFYTVTAAKETIDFLNNHRQIEKKVVDKATDIEMAKDKLREYFEGLDPKVIRFDYQFEDGSVKLLVLKVVDGKLIIEGNLSA